MLLDDAVALDALVLRSAGPVRLPGLLGWLGPVDMAVALGTLEGVTVDSTPVTDPWVQTPGTLDTEARDPWMVVARLAVAPHPRVRIAVNRLIIGLTRWNGEDIGPDDMLRIAVGELTVFDDQKASLEAAVRLDLFGVSVAPYLELAFEDAAGAIYEDPGVLLGLHVPAVPGLPTTSARWEYTAFGEDACYAGGCEPVTRNWFWHPLSGRLHAAPDGTLLGHPLGGYGNEHRLQLESWLADARLRLAVTGIVRERLPHNLRFDGSTARAYEGAATMDWGFASGWRLGLEASSAEPRALAIHVSALGLGAGFD